MTTFWSAAQVRFRPQVIDMLAKLANQVGHFGQSRRFAWYNSALWLVSSRPACVRFSFMAESDLLPVIVGGAIGLAGSWFPHFWKQRRAKASARAVARAYISGILKMEEVLRYSELFRKAQQDLQSGNPQALPRIYGAEHYPNNDPTRTALINQLGLLKPEDAEDLVLFLNMLQGFDVDAAAMARGKMADLTPD
jgi:hypothetical protein